MILNMGWGLLALDGLRRELSRTERIKVRVIFLIQLPLTLISPSGRILRDESRKGREDLTITSFNF